MIAAQRRLTTSTLGTIGNLSSGLDVAVLPLHLLALTGTGYRATFRGLSEFGTSQTGSIPLNVKI